MDVVHGWSELEGAQGVLPMVEQTAFMKEPFSIHHPKAFQMPSWPFGWRAADEVDEASHRDVTQ